MCSTDAQAMPFGYIFPRRVQLLEIRGLHAVSCVRKRGERLGDLTTIRDPSRALLTTDRGELVFNDVGESMETRGAGASTSRRSLHPKLFHPAAQRAGRESQPRRCSIRPFDVPLGQGEGL